MKYAGETGTVGILNVGAGDIKISFDPANSAERIRAARIVKDMLRRGYALLIEVEINGTKQFTRAIDFDETVCEYIVADFNPEVAAEEDSKESAAQSKPANKKRVKAESTRAVAVGRTAGG